jgi:glycosyltransferase involved in cell wall biosynthesis
MDHSGETSRHGFPRSGLPKLSVVIPCLDSAATLRASLESIQALGRRDIETVIIDGGSKDGTLSIIEERRSQIQYFSSGPDRGIYDAMNKGVDASRGQWILFLGSDDCLHQEFPRILDALLEPGTVYYGDVLLRSTGLRYGGAFSRRRIQFENICHQAILYPKVAFRDRSYRLEFKLLGDHELRQPTLT